MKKTLQLLAATFLLVANTFAQTIILAENFNSYDSTAASIPANWTLSDTGVNSYYTTTTSSGPSGPNSYKFRYDSTTATTPQFTGADSVHFWTRGNGVDTLSSLTILYTTDLTTWDTLTVLQPISTSGVMHHLSLAVGTKQLKFSYHKSVGNVAFDDFSVTGSSAGISNNSSASKPFTVYPNPTSGPLQINLNESFKSVKFSIYNMIGAEVKDVQIEKISNQKFKFNFENKQPGFYFIRIQTEKAAYTTRITITAALTEKRTERNA